MGRLGGSTPSSHCPLSVFVANAEGLLAGSWSALRSLAAALVTAWSQACPVLPGCWCCLPARTPLVLPPTDAQSRGHWLSLDGQLGPCPASQCHRPRVQFHRAAITPNCKWGLVNRTSHSSGGQKSEIKVSAGLCPSAGSRGESSLVSSCFCRPHLFLGWWLCHSDFFFLFFF